MRIIKKFKPKKVRPVKPTEYRLECLNCKSIVGATYEDLKRGSCHSTDRDGDSYSFQLTYVICAACGKIIALENGWNPSTSYYSADQIWPPP